MESSYGYSFIAHKKKYEEEKGIMFCIFPEVHCFARSSGSKRRDELHEKKNFIEDLIISKLPIFFNQE